MTCLINPLIGWHGFCRQNGAMSKALGCFRRPWFARLLFSCIGVFCLGTTLRADQAIYTDSLQNSWLDWSYATVNFSVTSPKHSGADSISVISTMNWQALYLHHAAFDGSAYTNLTFWINGGASGGQSVQVQATRAGTAQTAVVLAALPVNSWRQETISLASLGVSSAADLDGIWFQARANNATPVFYVDDISLISGSASPTNSSTAIRIDAQANRHPISPLVYGVAFATSNQLADLNSPLNRSGGNTETRYNWQLNAHN